MESAIQRPLTQVSRRFDYLPVAFFGSVAGLCGLSIAWRMAHVRFGAPGWIALAIGAVAIVDFVALAVAYGVKIMSAWDAVVREFKHPIAGSLFGTVFIDMLLLPLVIAPLDISLARGLWILGAIGMLVFAWLIVNRWMSDRQQVAHATPAWIIPVAGTLDVPIALPSLGLPPLHGVMVLALAIGFFFTIPIFTLIFSRLLFEEPLPVPQQSSLLILVAPFAVGFTSYVATVGAVDLFAQSLFALTLFLLAVLLNRMRGLLTSCPFRISWWAMSFPLAASAIAGLRMAIAAPGFLTTTIAIALLGGASLAMSALFIRTMIGLMRGELRALSA